MSFKCLLLHGSCSNNCFQVYLESVTMELTRSRLCLLVSLLAWASCFQGATSELDAAISQCQELAPSPPLAKFVDELPRLKDIRVWVDQQIIVGAFKIQQVSCIHIFYSSNFYYKLINTTLRKTTYVDSINCD